MVLSGLRAAPQDGIVDLNGPPLVTESGSTAHGWRDVPRFGTRSESKRLIVRPSAYGFILNRDGRLAVVRSPEGTFLPGGGIEEGETPEEAVVRETLEECGLVVHVGECVSRAVQLVVVEDVLLEKRSLFFDARIESESSRVEHGHETMWVAPAAADRLLSRESQSWAVRDWMERATG